jgi:shikimate kinase
MSRKKIYLLIGQKGSGKSFIGANMEKRFGITFIRVEDWAKQIKKDRAVENETYLKQVFEMIEKGVRESLKQIDKVVFESTGLTDYFDQMLENLKKDFHVITIGIYADGKTCLDRVKNRDQSIHINISDDQVTVINDKVRQKHFQTDHKINNEAMTEEELVGQIEKILKLESHNRRLGSLEY